MVMKNRKRTAVISLLAALCVLLAAGGGWLGYRVSQAARYEKQLSLGDKYLAELDYENAEIAYKEAIEISDRKPAGYVKLAVLYIETGDYEKAREIVEQGKEKSGEDSRLKELQETISRKDSGKDQGKAGELDWDQAFASTILGELPILEEGALSYTASGFQAQRGAISAQEVQLEGGRYLACLYLDTGMGEEGRDRNDLYLAVYDAEEEFRQIGAVKLALASAFDGSAISDQSLSVFSRERDGRVEWVFAMHTLYWGNMMEETAVIALDGGTLTEEWNSLKYSGGGPDMSLKLNGELIADFLPNRDNAFSEKEILETYKGKLSEMGLSEEIFKSAEGGEPVCRLENKSGTPAGSYTGTVEDYTGLRERMPEPDGEDLSEEEPPKEETIQDFVIAEAQWEKLGEVTGGLLWVLEERQKLNGSEPYATSAMDSDDLLGWVSPYLNLGRTKERADFPAAGQDGGKAYYDESTVHSFFRSAMGEAPAGPIQSEGSWGISYEGGRYAILMATGAPVYRSDYLQGTKQGGRVTVLVEQIELANVGTTSKGVYQVVYEEDAGSVFGYHIVSVLRLPEVDGAFTGITASSTLVEAGQDHSAAVLRDHDLTTAWSEGVSGNGEGESITLTAETAQKVHGIRIAPGFQKNQDLLKKNGRPTRLRFTFSDGTELEKEVPMNAAGASVGSSWESGREWLDFVSFGREIETEWIKITIVSAQAGTKYEDTCISEIVVY